MLKAYILAELNEMTPEHNARSYLSVSYHTTISDITDNIPSSSS